MLSKYFFELLHSNSLNFFRASAALWSTSTLKWRRRSMGSRRKNDASLWPLLSFYHQDLPAHREDSFFQCFFQDSRQAVYHNKPFFKVFYVPVHETCYLKSSSILLVSTDLNFHSLKNSWNCNLQLAVKSISRENRDIRLVFILSLGSKFNSRKYSRNCV